VPAALSEDSRIDQIKDFPEWYEVDPLTLGAREYLVEVRTWVTGVGAGMTWLD
jgi:hypothetical protein